jgi:hypothetical protein
VRRAARQAARYAAIEGRTRARRIANLRARQVFARQPAAERRARLAWLAQLAGAIEASQFTAEELMDAQAALAAPDPRQHRLDLRTSRNARA